MKKILQLLGILPRERDIAQIVQPMRRIINDLEAYEVEQDMRMYDLKNQANQRLEEAARATHDAKLAEEEDRKARKLARKYEALVA